MAKEASPGLEVADSELEAPPPSSSSSSRLRGKPSRKGLSGRMGIEVTKKPRGKSESMKVSSGDGKLETRESKSPFPNRPDHCGFLDLRYKKTKPWERTYVVLSNNFLLMAKSPLSTALDQCIPLEGSMLKSKAKESLKRAKAIGKHRLKHGLDSEIPDALARRESSVEVITPDASPAASAESTPSAMSASPPVLHSSAAPDSTPSLSAASKRKSSSRRRKSKKHRSRGSMISTKGSLTFDLTIRKQRLYFRAGNSKEAEIWISKMYTASKLRVKDLYELKSLLSENDTGTTKVMSAFHRITKQKVAIKSIVKNPDRGSFDETFDDPTTASRRHAKSIQREIMALKRLSHKNVVALLDVFESRNSIYLIMEFCEGGDLFNRIVETNDGSGFTERDALLITHEIAAAVEYCHSLGIVHRDLKPENVLCTRPDSVLPLKISDFGISSIVFDPMTIEKHMARRMGLKKRESIVDASPTTRLGKQRRKATLSVAERASLTKAVQSGHMFSSIGNGSVTEDDIKDTLDDPTGADLSDEEELPSSMPTMTSRASGHMMRSESGSYVDSMSTLCGTISYTAPEILLGRMYDYRVDYWSVGIILYILLCGYPPFYGNSPMEISEAIVSEEIMFDDEDFEHVSESGKQLVSGLLEKAPRKRSLLSEVFNHAWLTDCKEVVSTRRIKSFKMTVLSRNVAKRRLSMSVFERKSKRLDKLYTKRPSGLRFEDEIKSDTASSVSPTTVDRILSLDDSQIECSCFGKYHKRGCKYRTGLLSRRMSGGAMALSTGDVTLDHMLGKHRQHFSKTDDDLLKLRMPSSMLIPSEKALVDRGDEF